MNTISRTREKNTASIGLGKCGCNCAGCPTYKRNLKTIAKRKYCSAGWEKYLGIKLSPAKLRLCDGCSLPDSERKIYYLNCKIRKCALVNEVENCAYCSAYPCEELKNAHSVQEIRSRDEFMQKKGKYIPEDEYTAFVGPYAGLYHLDAVRRSLQKNDVKEFKKFSTELTFAPYPAIDGEKNPAGEIIYSLLRSVCCENNISYAHYQTLRAEREQFMKILWVMGFYGAWNAQRGCLELDAGTFSSQKIHCMYDTLLAYCSGLKRYGVQCEIIPTGKKGWLTPMRGLRKEGWFFRMSFGEVLHGKAGLQEFREYILTLNTKFRNRAFRIFNAADVSVMLK